MYQKTWFGIIGGIIQEKEISERRPPTHVEIPPQSDPLFLSFPGRHLQYTRNEKSLTERSVRDFSGEDEIRTRDTVTRMQV